MSRFQRYAGAFGLLTILAGGCTPGQQATQTPTPTPQAAQTPSPSPSPTPVPAPPPLALVPSIDPNARRDELMAGRRDPFAPPGASSAGGSGRPGDIVPIPPPPFEQVPAPVIGPMATAPLPGPIDISNTLSLPAMNPALANAVLVKGIIQVGNQVQAIVRSPNEPTERAVGPGQRLEGGLVLVKRIVATGLEPVVVLEQAGVEVFRTVGQPAEAPIIPLTEGTGPPYVGSVANPPTTIPVPAPPAP